MSSLIKVRHTKICCSASISIPGHTCCFKVYKFDAFSKEGRFVYLKPLQKGLPFQMSVDKLITTFCTNITFKFLEHYFLCKCES
ncbi:hypothetical protein T4B_3870 [Trichinella pseudospiralis]|uniref:Uncharacterized protein n=1 Tax=Trichinella pseudospiralis TaxID=6337 RepID=A0A0V1HV94_TRIPS|nr:hypothetical protein T4B_3870 [Trichinella pseudospiralis]